MIDTDKYEGHTPGPWQFDGIECVSGCGPHPTEEPVFATLHVDEQFMLTEENMLANGKLIADAPLLLAEVKRLRKLEAAVVGSWMETVNRGSSWHKQLRDPCVDLGYLELRDVEHITRIGNRYTSKHFCLKEEYEEMAKQWIKEEYGVVE